MDEFMRAAIDEARLGLAEGGIPIGSVVVHDGRIVGRGHNRRVQQGSTILHGEMDALERAGRKPASFYKECTLYTTLSPCPMCSGAILLYGIPRVVIGENRSFMGEEALLAGMGPADAGEEWLDPRRARWIFGTPDEAQGAVAQYAGAGVERIMLQTFLPRDLAMIDLAAEVLFA